MYKQYIFKRAIKISKNLKQLFIVRHRINYILKSMKSTSLLYQPFTNKKWHTWYSVYNTMTWNWLRNYEFSIPFINMHLMNECSFKVIYCRLTTCQLWKYIQELWNILINICTISVQFIVVTVYMISSLINDKWLNRFILSFFSVPWTCRIGQPSIM